MEKLKPEECMNIYDTKGVQYKKPGIVYHYSPKTNMPEVCLAASMFTCPYRAYHHTSNKAEAVAYADRENRLAANLKGSWNSFFLHNKKGGISMTMPDIFAEDAQSALHYLGFSNDLHEVLRYNRAIIAYADQPGLVNMLQDVNRFDMLMEGAEKAYQTGSLKEHYNKFDMLPYIQPSTSTHNFFDVPIITAGNDATNYTINRFIQDYVRAGTDWGYTYKIPKGNHEFYVFFFE